METYHRKRSKRGTINANHGIMSLKREETSSVLDGAPAQTPPLARQLLLYSNDEVPNEDVELGSVYEIYHKNLPPRTPLQLRSTRVVMVSEKTDMNVAIRYPSILSLSTYFKNGISEMYPALDEKFVMGIKLASKVLLRQVPSQEFAQKKHLEDFWLVNPNPLVTKKDMGLVRELKNSEMVRWGVRRQVVFIGRHKEITKTQSSSSFIQGEEEVKDLQVVNDEEVEEEEEVDDEAEEETHDEDLKRKVKSTRILRKRKRNKHVNHTWQVSKKPMKKCKKLVLRDPTDRWSKERYMAAEQSLLEAMKEKQAMIGNPITRPALRVEARKRIGDTGLLDHLLKHVANKVAPGGKLRFRRSHNADGAMEYWLENADLLKIRKDAGVTDPFWTPPPGWKPGDSPIQDPIMAKELNLLKEEISNIKREFLSKMQYEEEVARLRREIEELSSKNKRDEFSHDQALVCVDTSPEQQALVCVDKSPKQQALVCVDKSPKQQALVCVDKSPKQLVDLSNSLLPNSESDIHFSREECKKQMLVISDFLKKIEAWMETEGGKETSKSTKSGTELISITAPSSDDAERIPEKPKHKELAVVEGKAAKIERLKSGFRLCRPQGTFLWPNMVMKNHPSSTTSCTSTSTTCTSSQVMVQVEVVPTPPSVNSSKSYMHLSHQLPSPVKPVPERRPLLVTPVNSHQLNVDDSNVNKTTTTALINLNDIPPTNPSSTSQQTTTTHEVMKREAAYGYKKSHELQKRIRTSSTSSCFSNTSAQQWF
ncbi:hypothetical protein OSB04_017301 [Centaurea solstitialis]|uniref:PTC1-like winged helix-turn-helix domain-containing protein n=1 Tax=Centaurea solstitialis TaxID=347529 RepID=A0AA38TDM0_9ASTR|nr:hypothetical protein OSB04_017301 [Centaurea solstitialis]